MQSSTMALRHIRRVSLLYFGREGCLPSKIELQVKTWRPDPAGGYDFVEAEQKWYCENDEVERLVQRGVMVPTVVLEMRRFSWPMRV